VSPVELTDRGEVVGGDGEKAWSSINQLILFALPSPAYMCISQMNKKNSFGTLQPENDFLKFFLYFLIEVGSSV
jgi:hypothetical protein